MIAEKSVDRSFVRRLKALGLWSIKISAMGRYGSSGWPDRLVILPGGRVCWVELKRPGGAATALQLSRHRDLGAAGHSVGVFDDPAAAIEFVVRSVGAARCQP